MKDQILYTKTYGVMRGYWKGALRWFVVSDGGWATEMNYAKKETAIKKSHQFIKACWPDHTKARFEFIRKDLPARI